MQLERIYTSKGHGLSVEKAEEPHMLHRVNVEEITKGVWMQRRRSALSTAV